MIDILWLTLEVSVINSSLMKGHRLIFSEDSPIKQVLYKILFIDSLLVTFAISSAIALGHSPDLHFREAGFLTYVSCLKLLIAAVISGKIFGIIKNSPNHKLSDNKIVWLVITLGLLFLALDDALKIHEEIDALLHDVLNITQTNITDLLDDLIVGAYILIFLIFIAFQWKTIQLFRSSFVFFLAGLVFTVVMVSLDLISHNTYVASLMTDDAEQIQALKQWFSAWEDAAKIYAEGMFIVGVYKCRQIAKSIDSKQ